MGTVKRLAEAVEGGLRDAHPGLRKTVIKKLALAVGAVLEGQTPNTVELANLLPLATERQDRREQWLRRLLKNPLLSTEVVMEPLARQELERAARNGQIVLLSLDQTDLGNRMAVLMVGVRVGDRSLPLAWLAEAGAANIGFEGQWIVWERMLAWLPVGTPVMLSADRFYPSAALFEWLHSHALHHQPQGLSGHGHETLGPIDGVFRHQLLEGRKQGAIGDLGKIEDHRIEGIMIVVFVRAVVMVALALLDARLRGVVQAEHDVPPVGRARIPRSSPGEGSPGVPDR